jgi:predicted transcriptional regulator
MSTKRGRKPKGDERMDVTVSAMVDSAMKKRLAENARDMRVPESHIIREALREYLAKRKAA